MDWIKIPINEILLSGRRDWENYALIKYQALYLQLETEPSDIQLKRILNKKELEFVQSNCEVVSNLIQSQLNVVNKKRNHNKIKYLENKNISKIQTSDRQLSAIKDKTRVYKENNNLKVITKESDLSFVEVTLLDDFKAWLEYKLERKECYKSQKSIKACYNHLLNLSGCSDIKAITPQTIENAKKIIQQSMANNWAGLFELKSRGSPKSSLVETDEEFYAKLNAMGDGI